MAASRGGRAHWRGAGGAWRDWAARHAAGLGPGAALCALLGSGVAVLLPALPPPGLAAACALLGAGLMWRAPRLRMPALGLLAFAWTAFAALQAMHARLPHALEGLDLHVQGRIVGLPESREGAQRFDFLLESAAYRDRPLPLHGRLRLAAFAAQPQVRPCQRWRFTVRLKRPHGVVNPGGFDTERAAVAAGVTATGYLRDAPAVRLPSARMPCVDALRARISGRIAGALPSGDAATPLLKALAVGDQRGLDATHWRVLRATGVGHLIAISGLHVGLAGIAGALLVHVLTLLWPRLLLWRPRPVLAAPVALAAAWGYGALAGYGLPTVRTLLMIAVVAWAAGRRRRAGVAQMLALALLAVLAADPLALLGAGFWLSYAGVAMLAYALQPARGWRGWLAELGLAQGVMALALLPLTALLFGQASRVGPLANLVAVPLMGLVIVPLILLAGLLLLAGAPGGDGLTALAASLMRGQWRLLQLLADRPWALAWLPWPGAAAFALASLGVLWVLAPRGVPARMLGLLLLAPLLWPRLPPLSTGGFEARVFDVGQGSAVLVRTGRHALLYDAGPRYRSGFNLGEAAVLPGLQALGVRRLDAMVLSHGDSDHVGGAFVLRATYPSAALLGSEGGRIGLPLAPCRHGRRWSWDGVDFEVLHPGHGDPAQGNESSCVLHVRGRGGALLLTGDIGARSERAVAARWTPDVRPLTLLLAHHGSGSASSGVLLDALAPQRALVSAGYRNAYGHPHPRVRERLRARGIPLYDTATFGALTLRCTPDCGPVQAQRRSAPHWWRE